MNISQHLALFVKDVLDCKTVFTLTGGGAMFLNDAFGNTEGLDCIYTHHEQAAAMAALGYSKYRGIGVCVTTTGCGATNALTGLLDAWQDSQPVLFISGQVKKKETTYFSGLPLRSFGVQELDIIPVVTTLTKKAICIGSKEQYFDSLARLPEWLFAGRPGPVWIDIPMDVQSQELTLDELDITFRNSHHPSILSFQAYQPDPVIFESLVQELSHSKRPIVIVGNGLRLSQNGSGIEEMKQFCIRQAIPLVSTYLAADFFLKSTPNYLGVAGLKAARRANIALYNADLIIAIGTRLATSVIGFEYEKFAPQAKVFIVDIDQVEHMKATRDSMSFIFSDASTFASSLSKRYLLKTTARVCHVQWLDQCLRMKELLPVQEQFSPEGSVSIYDAIERICQGFGANDVLVSDAGSAYYVASIMFSKSESQRYITSGAQADMGFSLPAAIGVAAACGESDARVHAVTGDGSFQLNLQELQTLVTSKLPVTIYILNNNGYLSIRATQSTFFSGRECGTGPSTGVEFPCIRKLCDAYKIPYRRASSTVILAEIVEETKASQLPLVCEVICPENEGIVPRTRTIRKDDGTLESAPLCDMYPPLAAHLLDSLAEMGFKC